MNFMEGAFRDWVYELATTEFRDQSRHRAGELDPGEPRGEARPQRRGQRPPIEPGHESPTPEKKAARGHEGEGRARPPSANRHGDGKWKSMVMVDDRIADRFPADPDPAPEYSVLCTLNLNGDYISDAAAAVVGGLGMAPGPTSATRGDLRGHPWHGPQARRPRPHQPGLGDPLRRHDARVHGLARSGPSDHPGASARRSSTARSPTTWPG